MSTQTRTHNQLLIDMLMDLSRKVAMVGGMGATRDWIVAEISVIISHAQDAQPSSPTVDQIMEVVDDYFDDARFDIPWDILHRGEGKDILRARLTKLLNP